MEECIWDKVGKRWERVVGRDWVKAGKTSEKGDARTGFWNDFVRESYLNKVVEVRSAWSTYLGELGAIENGCKVWTWERRLAKVVI